MNRSSTIRLPALGVVPASGTVTVEIEKPIATGEVPVVLTHQPNTLEIRAFYPTSVEVVNRTALPIPYVLIVVPSFAIKLAAAPWARLIEAIRSPIGRSAILEQLTQLFLHAGRQLRE